MTVQATQQIFMLRVAQALARRAISSQREAEQVGKQIAAYALAHWEQISRTYAAGAEDSIEIMERWTKEALARRARYETNMHHLMLGR